MYVNISKTFIHKKGIQFLVHRKRRAEVTLLCLSKQVPGDPDLHLAVN